MAMEFEFDIIARETIKPSSPTPHHLRDFRLSFLDQMTPVMYTPVVLFYSPNGNQTDQPAGRSHLLKISLSKVLTGFYPFAGRIRDHTSVECSDDGVEYIEARVHFPLSVALQQPDAMIVRKFLPVDVESEKAVSGGLLLVQVTSFRCGGMAIGVCMSHKLADASTLATFINSWATMAVGSSDAALMTPQFPVASLFPAKESPVPPLQLVPGRCLTRRYLFDAANIAALKAKATSPSVEQPTRVEVVTALLWKCLMSISRSINGRPRLALITHTVNLRGRININPPLTESIVGNLSGMFTAQWEEPDSTDLQALVLKLREGIQELTNKAKETDKNMAEETYQTVLQVRNLAMAKAGDIDIYACSSWCRFLLYEPDFGWGKPTWVSPGCWTYSNTIFLMDTRDGNGIEVLVTLDEEDIGLIDQNEELLEFSLYYANISSKLSQSSSKSTDCKSSIHCWRRSSLGVEASILAVDSTSRSSHNISISSTRVVLRSLEPHLSNPFSVCDVSEFLEPGFSGWKLFIRLPEDSDCEEGSLVSQSSWASMGLCVTGSNPRSFSFFLILVFQ